MNNPVNFNFSCPIQSVSDSKILLVHGGGGSYTNKLLENVFFPAFQNSFLEKRHDGAVFSLPPHIKLAFTTDSFVVKPLFFPGGDIGKLAIFGTVNDLAMCGAVPKYLSAAFILEEGLPMDILSKIVESMRCAATEANVQLITGDTKVVDKGKGDGIFITTTGIGFIEHNIDISPFSIRPNDAIILSGDIGRHGMAIMAQREGFDLNPPIESDCAQLAFSIKALLDANIEVHCLRDLTRGGISAALIEIASTAKLSFEIEEEKIIVSEEVRGICEILGIDPFHVANEGRFIAFVPHKDIDKAMNILAQTAPGKSPSIIGIVLNDSSGVVNLKTIVGTHRILDMPSGEPLPRIC